MKLPPYLTGSSPWTLTKLAAAAFPIAYLETLPIWFFCHRFKSYIAQNAVFKALNSIFIERYGYLLFIVAHFSYAALYVDNRTTFRIQTTQLMLKFCIITSIGILFHGGFSRFSLVELVNTITGGHCEGATKQTTMARCQGDPTLSWVDGFDISSHYYFLITSCLILINDLVGSLQRPIDLESQIEPSPLAEKVRSVVYTFTSFLLVIWIFEFIMTSIFFHTALERFFGLLGVPAALVTIYLNDKIFSSDSLDPEELDE